MAIDGVVEEVASNLDEAAAATRALDARALGFLGVGLLVGAGVGFFFGYRWNREKLRAEAFAESEKEVEQIREAYAQRAGIVTERKPDLEEVVEEKGYTTPPGYSTIERPLKPPVPVAEPMSAVGVWNYPEEIQNRNPDFPYVIHQDEVYEMDEAGYNHTAYTYYALDDVLCDESDRPLPHADLIVGQNNLKFGHGSDDPDVVFVRNDKMSLVMEICRIQKSYAEEVLGHDHAPGS